MSELILALENFRKKTRGDMGGEELYAFARLEKAVKESLSAFPKVWCSNCGETRPTVVDMMKADSKNDHDAADILCGECHFIVATLHKEKS
mgnify:CR=1 FL=1